MQGSKMCTPWRFRAATKEREQIEKSRAAPYPARGFVRRVGTATSGSSGQLCLG